VPAAEFLLEHMSNSLYDPVDPTQVGSLSSELRAYVNGEIYRFAGSTTLARFRRNPVRWCGVLRDPVTGVRFMPTQRSPRLEMPDGPYFFPSDSCRRAFAADTAHFVIHRTY